MPVSPERLFALAWRLEEHGQINNAKLLRAAADALTRRSASLYLLTKDQDSLAAILRQTAENLQSLDLTKLIGDQLYEGAAAMSEGRVPMIADMPDVYVCRSCGEIGWEEAEPFCPVCGYHNATRKRFAPVYWLNHFDPPSALEKLKTTPEDFRALIESLDETALTSTPNRHEWSIRKTFLHVMEGQKLLEFRVDLLIDQERPVLESMATWLVKENAGERPQTTREIFSAYAASRQRVIERLAALPLPDWWRQGFHQEFGWVSIGQQASYFATHELSHFQQMRGLLPTK